MNFDSITIGQIVTFITSTGIIFSFLYKIFSLFNQVKLNTKSITKAHERIDNLKEESNKQKDELLNKVEETNLAVNLLCTAISALIDNEINECGNIEALKKIKTKLDEKKEIV